MKTLAVCSALALNTAASKIGKEGMEMLHDLVT